MFRLMKRIFRARGNPLSFEMDCEITEVEVFSNSDEIGLDGELCDAEDIKTIECQAEQIIETCSRKKVG